MYFRHKEPHFGSPLAASQVLKIRNDSYGGGLFGDPRGSRNDRIHEGIDLLAKVGDPVLASKSGRVAFAGGKKGYGNCIDLIHSNGVMTKYAHLAETWAAPGIWVQKGREVGLCGKSGNASNPRILAHLHFEIRSKSKALDPLKGQLDPSLTIIQ